MKLISALSIAIPCTMGATIVVVPSIVAAVEKRPEPVPPEPTPVESDYLTFTAIEDSKFHLEYANDSTAEDFEFKPTLFYSFDQNDWVEYHWTEEIADDALLGEEITLQKDQTISLYGDNPNGWSIYYEDEQELSYDCTTQFVMEGNFAISGNVMTLIDKTANDQTVIPSPYCFYELFFRCDISSSKDLLLPAKQLKKACYREMFYGCEMMTETLQELPAEELSEQCYRNMFYDCNITKAPVLQGKKLADRCYNYMFDDCDKLLEAPELLATELAENCYWGMFRHCASLVTAPELNATNLADGCYRSMFYRCSKLTSAPILPATNLKPDCYSNMFGSCTSLVEAPYLPATELCFQCYSQMFDGCSSLSIIMIEYAGDFPPVAPDYEFYNWVRGVAKQGTFYYLGSDTTRGNSAIPEGWEIINV